MLKLHKNKRYLKAFIVIILVVFSTSAMAANFGSARIIPREKVLIYRGDQQVGELTAEAPFPDGALLACKGDCAVRMDDILLVGADKSLFSITTRAQSRELQVRNGTVYFALSKMTHSLVFVTPNGVVTVQQLILNAAADGGPLKGYVEVTGESSEIGVIEGGSMLLSTVEGETTIQSGKKIILAKTEDEEDDDPEEGAIPPPEKSSGGYRTAAIVGGAALAGIAVIAIASGGSGGGGGGGGPSSPAAP